MSEVVNQPMLWCIGKAQAAYRFARGRPHKVIHDATQLQGVARGTELTLVGSLYENAGPHLDGILQMARLREMPVRNVDGVLLKWPTA